MMMLAVAMTMVAATVVLGNAVEAVWTRVTEHEASRYQSLDRECTHEFEHCCLGQCRVHYMKKNVSDVLYKWDSEKNGNRRLANILDLLDSLGAQEGSVTPTVAKKIGPTIYFVGDSLSSDLAMAAVCQLLSAGYQLSSCQTSGLGGELYGIDRNYTCKANILPMITHFLLEKNNMLSTLVPTNNVLILFSFGTIHKEVLVKLGGGIVVYNVGVHCNDLEGKLSGEKCLARALDNQLVPFVTGSSESHKLKQWSFFFREHEPQHFSTPNGTFKPGALMEPCAPTKYPDNWRNEYVHRFIAKHNLSDKVPILPSFNLLEPLWQLHYGKGDCTHYCYSPWRFDVTWDAMLRALA
mmetsp:Transcript_47281/g.81325  ORF Transcript_47281/g.81325 Transcript_47281/m.81325 type:complete len:352 (+) Transcript_47281:44-1099(+)